MFRIVTDTSANLPTGYLHAEGITVIPYTFQSGKGEQACMDLTTFDAKEFYVMWVDDEHAWFAFKRQVMEVMEMTKEELLSLKGTGDHPSDWAREAAEWAKQAGVFTGDSAGNFGWQQPITREAVAKLLYEYDQARGVDSGAADMVK